MRLFPIILLPLWVIAAHGCQWLNQLDQTRNLDNARRDHANCNERGYSWPGEAYEECRRLLADQRQREQWMELQMSRQQQVPEVGIQPESPIEPYRPIRPGNFTCSEETSSTGETLVLCRERDGAAE